MKTRCATYFDMIGGVLPQQVKRARHLRLLEDTDPACSSINSSKNCERHRGYSGMHDEIHDFLFKAMRSACAGWGQASRGQASAVYSIIQEETLWDGVSQNV
jgi:hypothetical protein